MVIEGLDGSGKTLQIAMLSKFLRAAGRELITFDFPSYEKTLFGKLCGQYLSGKFGEMEELEPKAVALLYAGDRLEQRLELMAAVNNYWQGDERPGRVVLANRYVSSNIAYQTARHDDQARARELETFIKRLEYESFGLPHPDLTVFLDIPVALSQRLVAAKATRSYLTNAQATPLTNDAPPPTHDMHERNAAFLERVRDRYNRMANIDNTVTVLPVTNSQGELYSPESIQSALRVLLFSKGIINNDEFIQGGLTDGD